MHKAIKIFYIILYIKRNIYMYIKKIRKIIFNLRLELKFLITIQLQVLKKKNKRDMNLYIYNKNKLHLI